MNIQRVKELFQFILLTASREDDFFHRRLGSIHLLKYAYLADLAYARHNGGKTWTGIEWKFHHYGPWSAEACLLIDDALIAIGAEQQAIPSIKFEEDAIRWETEDDERTYNDLYDKTHLLVAGEVQRRVHEFGSDTSGLLHFVYCTPPMLTAAPGEILDFMVVILDPVVEACPEPPTVKLTPRQQKKKNALLADLKKQYKEKCRNRVAPKKMEMTPPRYDEVFFEGTAALDAMAGPDIPKGKFEATFSDDLWKSKTRYDPELP